MTPFRCRWLPALALLLLGAASALAQPFTPLADHLKCYKVKDPLKLVGVVDLDSPQLGLEQGCKIGKAKLFCVPVRKRVVQVTPSTPMPILGDQQVDDRICYKIKCPTTVIPPKDVVDQFGMRVLTKFRASLLCTPARKKPIENDLFPATSASVTIQPGSLGCPGGETVNLTGPTAVNVALGALADTDGNGREQVPIEMVQLSLTGNSACYGPVSVMLRDPSLHPHRRTTGEIEESANTQTARLDLPPFAPSGTATSFFDVYFEVQASGLTLHNHTPKHMDSVITHKPPNPGDQYNNPDVIQLYDENENPFPIRIGAAQHVPNTLPSTTTTTTSTTTTTQPVCALVIGPSGPTCAGSCSAGTTCLMDPPHSGQCLCAVDARICTNQTFPSCAPPAGLCAGQAEECQTRPGNVCGCCRVPGSQCTVGSQCCSNICMASQCQP
jgi:hypothetical protein